MSQALPIQNGFMFKKIILNTNLTQKLLQNILSKKILLFARELMEYLLPPRFYHIFLSNPVLTQAICLADWRKIKLIPRILANQTGQFLKATNTKAAAGIMAQNLNITRPLTCFYPR